MEDTVESVINEITGHIDFLRSCGLSVTVSCFSPVFAPVLPVLLQYEVHLCSVCAYLKANAKTMGMCVKNKRKLHKKRTDTPYYSCCFAGVEEFVFPVHARGMRIMCINISGYRSTLKKSGILKEKIAQLCGDSFDELYGELNESPPSLTAVSAAISPLIRSVLALYEQCLQKGENERLQDGLYCKMLVYVYDNYMYDISLTEIAQTLNYSESYLRHVFKKTSGVSLGEYINTLRLSSAAALLKKNLSVAEIAGMCGFTDANYFAVAFKKKYGVSPRDFKRLNLGGV